MTYRVNNLIKNGNTWTGSLQQWEGCICESTHTPFEIEQEKSPTLKEIIESLHNSPQP